jgi:hypothetical protein
MVADTGVYLGGWLHEAVDNLAPVLLDHPGNEGLFTAIDEFVEVRAACVFYVCVALFGAASAAASAGCAGSMTNAQGSSVGLVVVV